MDWGTLFATIGVVIIFGILMVGAARQLRISGLLRTGQQIVSVGFLGLVATTVLFVTFGQ